MPKFLKSLPNSMCAVLGLFFIPISYFYYIIILPIFGFQRGYGVTERLDFILTEINGYYKSNDRLKFILLFD